MGRILGHAAGMSVAADASAGGVSPISVDELIFGDRRDPAGTPAARCPEGSRRP